MLELLSQYIALTEIDARRVELGRQLERYPEMIAGMNHTEAEHQARLDKARAALEKARSTRRTAEKEVETLRAQARKFAARQADVKTNKEYEALSAEIARTNEQIDAQETIGLECLEKEETAQTAIAAAEKALAALKLDQAGERTRIAEQQTEKSARLARLDQEYADLFARLDESEQEEYGLIRKRHPGSACAPALRDHCGGCSRQLVAHVVQEIQQADRLIQCEYCRRFLVPESALHA